MEENQFAVAGEKQLIPLFMIDANPWQTSEIDQAHAEELAHDIKENGMMQAPTARPVDGRFQLAFGHHRLAAYRLLSTLGQEYYDNFPLYIHDLNDEQMAIAAFSENEKRRTMNPVDRARAVKKMLDDFGWTQELVAERLHIDRSGVSNMLRMLRLPQDVLDSVAAGDLPVRSAMALIPIFEVTTSEGVRLEDRFGESLTDFLNGAKKGEVNSDVIRARVDFYMNFLHPEPEQLPFAKGSENEEPVIIDNETITANEEVYDPSMGGQIITPQPPMPQATQAHIDEWLDKPDGAGEDDGAENDFGEPEIETDGEGSNQGSQNQNVEVKATPPTIQPVPAENHPVEKPTLDTELKKDPEDPNAIYLSVAWKTKGVTVSVLKPGWIVPKFRFSDNLKIELLPSVIREMLEG